MIPGAEACFPMRQRQRNKTPLPLIETFHPAQNNLLRFLIIPSKRVHQKVRFSSTNNLPGYPDPLFLAFRTFLDLLSVISARCISSKAEAILP